MKKIILLLYFLSIFIISPKSILAQEYVVQPRIIIPSDYESRTPASLIENEYKPSIILALKEVQAWYAKQLNGKTFKIKEDVSILRLKKPAGDTKGMTPVALYLELGRTGLLIDNESVLNVLWLVGTNTNIDQGGWDYLDNNPNRQIQVAWMNNDNLIKINSKRDTKERNVQLGVLAHELGHAFGLVFDGRAKGHTCSVEKIEECNGGPPYPAKKFWYSSVMGYGGYPLFPDVGLNNTPDNPEVRKALLSPFLNPDRLAGPTPADDSTTFIPPTVQILSIWPNVLSTDKQGTIVIGGQGFGGKEGKVNFYKAEDNTWYKSGEVVSWQPDNIRVKTFVQHNFDQKVKIEVTNDFGQKALSNQEITLKGATDYQLNSYKSDAYHISSYNVFASCGEEEIPYPGITFGFARASYQDSLYAKGVTNENGKLGLTIPYIVKEQTGLEHLIKVYSGHNGQAPDQYQFIPNDFTRYDNSTFKFHFQDCPPEIQRTIPSSAISGPQGGLEPAIAEDDNTVQQVIISNSDDFTTRQDVSGAEINRVEIVENPDEEKEVIWEQPLTGGSEDIFIRVVENDGDIKDYQADLSDGSYTEVGGVQIVARVVKKVNQINLIPVGDESNKIILYDAETGYQNPEIDLPNNLNLFKIVTIFDDGSEEEDSSFYIEKAQETSQEPVDVPELVPEAPIPGTETSTNALSSCVWDDKLGRMVVVPNNDNPFDCQTQGQICQEFTNDEGKQDARCVNPFQEGEQ